jgi:hypothetical protein
MVSRKKVGFLLLTLAIAALCLGAVTQIDLTFQVKGLLPGTNGGTGVSSTATYPASGTIMTTATSVACSQMPALTGAVTSSAGSCATSVSAGLNFADAEVPTGLINGSNTSYSLAHTPSPAASLNCFENGASQRASGADLTLSTATITYGTAPPTGTTLVCYYRY